MFLATTTPLTEVNIDNEDYIIGETMKDLENKIIDSNFFDHGIKFYIYEFNKPYKILEGVVKDTLQEVKLTNITKKKKNIK